MIWDVHPGSGLIFYPSRIPYPVVKKALAPVSGSTTLFSRLLTSTISLGSIFFVKHGTVLKSLKIFLCQVPMTGLTYCIIKKEKGFFKLCCQIT
jgi:hypothetical protein